MADAPGPKRSDSSKSPLKTRVVRSQKILSPAAGAGAASDSDDSSVADGRSPLPRSHTPGHLASKSGGVDDRRRVSELTARQRSQSVNYNRPSTSSSAAKPPPLSNGKDEGEDRLASYGKKPLAVRSTSAIASSQSSMGRTLTSASRPPRGQHTPFPPLQRVHDAPDVPPAPAS
jgi:hypothetical protein